MNITGRLCSEEMLEVTVEIFRPPIQTFVNRMTEDQWTLLRSGSPDNATKILLAELLLEMIQAMTNLFLGYLKNTSVIISEEQVQAKLGDTLVQSFAEALDIKDQHQCVSSERLTNLLAKEVTQSVSSALSADKTTESGMSQHITRPARLNNMINHTSKMLKKFVKKCGKMKMCTPRARQKGGSRSSSQMTSSSEVVWQYLRDGDDRDHCQSQEEKPQAEEESPQDPFVLPDLVDEDDDDSCQSQEEEPQAEEESPQDPFVAETAKIVQEIIGKAVDDITEPLFQDAEDSEYELLKSETSSDIEVVSKDIAKIIASEFKTLIRASKHKGRVSLKGAGSVIKNFFTKVLAKASLHRMVTQLKKKFHQKSKAESSQSMEVIFKGVDHLLTEEDGDIHEDRGGNELCVFPRYKTPSGTNVVVITKELTEMIYCYIRYGNMMPEIIPEAMRRKAVAVPQVDAAMYEDIRKKVRCFLALINWWQKTQAASHSDRVTLALQHPESLSQTQSAEVNVEEEHISLTPTAVAASESEETQSRYSQELVERKEMSVLFLVERLVSRLYNKAKVKWTVSQPEVIIRCLFRRIWAEVEDVNLTITPETFERLDKAVFKDLVKEWACAENVLVLMSLEDPDMEEFLTSSFCRHLVTKKRNAITRFFSAMGRALSKPFRRTQRFGVI
eukprot:superscaffoldBa00011999_g25471